MMVMSMTGKITSKGQTTLPKAIHDKLGAVKAMIANGAKKENRESSCGKICFKQMAVRLSKAFGPSPDMWVRLQANYDLSQVRQDEISVARYKRAS